MDKKPLIVIAGPTASGKTALSLDIAEHFDTEIVSADSMQVYRHMDIGTAKPTIAERRGIVHHMIDEAMPNEEFSVVKYAALANRYMKDIHSRGKIPVMVGGTGLYIDSVVDNIVYGEAGIDHSLRDKFADIASEKGNQHLHDMLAEIDPESAKRIHCNNLRRVIRALEVYHTSGTAISQHQSLSKLVKSPYNAIIFMPVWDRSALYERIDRRVDIMMRDGLVDEVINLIKMGYEKGLTSMQGIGYKEVLDYYYGLSTLNGAVDMIKRNSRRYAKRQITWFKRNESIIGVDANTCDISRKCIAEIEKWLCESSKKNIYSNFA